MALVQDVVYDQHHAIFYIFRRHDFPRDILALGAVAVACGVNVIEIQGKTQLR